MFDGFVIILRIFVDEVICVYLCGESCLSCYTINKGTVYGIMKGNIWRGVLLFRDAFRDDGIP